MACDNRDSRWVGFLYITYSCAIRAREFPPFALPPPWRCRPECMWLAPGIVTAAVARHLGAGWRHRVLELVHRDLLDLGRRLRLLGVAVRSLPALALWPPIGIERAARAWCPPESGWRRPRSRCRPRPPERFETPAWKDWALRNVRWRGQCFQMYLLLLLLGPDLHGRDLFHDLSIMALGIIGLFLLLRFDFECPLHFPGLFLFWIFVSKLRISQGWWNKLGKGLSAGSQKKYSVVSGYSPTRPEASELFSCSLSALIQV